MYEVRVPVLHVFLTPWSFLSRHRVAQRPSVLHGRQFNEFLLEICQKACLNLSVLTVRAIVIFSSAHVFWATILYKHLETVLVIPLVPLDFHLFAIEPSTVLQCTHLIQEINQFLLIMYIAIVIYCHLIPNDCQLERLFFCSCLRVILLYPRNRN